MGIIVLLLILEERFSTFKHWVWSYLWLCYKWTLFCWDFSPVWQLCWEFLSWVLNFVKCFLCIYWDDHVILFIVSMQCITLINFWILAMLASLEWIQLDYGVWSFLYIVKFGLPIFFWGFLHLYSSEILTYSFPFVVFFIWFCK